MRGSRRPVQVQLLPAGRWFTAHTGDTLLDAALAAGIGLEHECGGNCSCTTCHVWILDGADCLSSIQEPEEYRLEFAHNRASCSRLACQAILEDGPVTFQIPELLQESS